MKVPLSKIAAAATCSFVTAAVSIIQDFAEKSRPIGKIIAFIRKKDEFYSYKKTMKTFLKRRYKNDCLFPRFIVK